MAKVEIWMGTDESVDDLGVFLSGIGGHILGKPEIIAELSLGTVIVRGRVPGGKAEAVQEYCKGKDMALVES